MTWFVSYDTRTGVLHRAGEQAEPQPDEPGCTCAAIVPSPVHFDPFTGQRAVEWNATARAYVPVVVRSL